MSVGKRFAYFQLATNDIVASTLSKQQINSPVFSLDELLKLDFSRRRHVGVDCFVFKDVVAIMILLAVIWGIASIVSRGEIRCYFYRCFTVSKAELSPILPTAYI